jgi:predicted nucleotidyltransferase
MTLKNSHYAKLDAPWLKPLVGNPVGALASHWLFQGMLQMDPTERRFKLGLDGVLTWAAARILRRRMSEPAAWLTGLCVAHTLNFLFNGQVYGVLKHFGGVTRSWEEFDAEVDGLRARVAAEPSIVYAAAYGSLARDHWSPTSDLDVRVVRAPGISAGLRAAWFALKERTRALWRRFPLDLLVYDSYSSLDAMAEKDTPVVLESVAAQPSVAVETFAKMEVRHAGK